jgi:hypothetical protein
MPQVFEGICGLFVGKAGRRLLTEGHLAGSSYWGLSYTVVEGYTRLSVLTYRRLRNQVITMPHIDLILGVCPRMTEWYLNDDNTNALCLESIPKTC